MHELSLVHSIIKLASQHTKANNATKVDQIELEIGTLAGVEMDAFLFAWNASIPGTILENAKRIIHKVQAKARCKSCGTEFDIQELYDVCPQCANYVHHIFRGKELKLKTLVVS